METPSDADADADAAGKSSSKAKQASRSVSLLTPEQLIRKRAQDRESQRQTRQASTLGDVHRVVGLLECKLILCRLRVKQTIAELERRVEDLTKQLIAAKLENDSLKTENQLNPPGPQRLPPPLADPNAVYPGLEVVARRKSLQTSQYTANPLQSSMSFVVPGPISAGEPLFSFFFPWDYVLTVLVTEVPQGGGMGGVLDPSLFSQYMYDDCVPTLSIPVWEARPCHYPPTCRLDKIIHDIIASRKPLNAIGGNDYEFVNAKFPAVSALLNPQHHANTYPLTTTIVSVCD
jgi:hypothetical protein